MTVVKAHCSACTANLELPGHEVLLTVHSHQKWRDTYRFTCPICREENVKPADERAIALLLGATVRVERVHVPDELDDPTRWDLQPLTWDDVFDFTDALHITETLERRWAS